MANAKNVEQAHQLARWVSTAEGTAAWAAFSANPVGKKGGIDLTREAVKKFYASGQTEKKGPVPTKSALHPEAVVEASAHHFAIGHEPKLWAMLSLSLL
jgi:hypothetical protein